MKALRKTLTFRAETVKLKEEWIKDIKNAIYDYKERQKTFVDRLDSEVIPGKVGWSAPVWIPDDQVSMCHTCNAVFNMITRRHHCRGCGIVTCNSCSDQTAPLRYKDFKTERVCETCFDILYQGECVKSILCRNNPYQFDITQI